MSSAVLMNVRSGVGRAIAALADLCYPPQCAACGVHLGETDLLCGSCDEGLLKLSHRPGCPACARPLTTEGAPCPWCHGRGVGRIGRVSRLGLYREPLRSLIHRMKYEGRWPLAETLADRLLELPLTRRILADADLLVPVPLHFVRQMMRGYNQADVLARQLGLRSGVAVAHPAIRLRNTATQTHLSSQEARMQNMRNAFAVVDPQPIASRRVVLVDDVSTSSATLTALAREIWRARPAGMDAIVLAIADPGGRDFSAI